MDRKEAIEIVQKNYPHVGTSGSEFETALRELVPELKESESEDERVRKEIVKFVATVKDIAKSGRNSWAVRKEDVEMCERFLAYLEKQKDERELSFIEGKMEGVRQTCQEIKDAMSLFEPKDLTPFEFTFRDYIDSAIRYCLAGEGYQQYIKEWAADLLNLEKQKEQRPTPIFKIGDMVCDTNHNRQPVYRIVSMDRKCYICESNDQSLGDRAVVHFGFDNPYLRLVEQKPAEWNDADMNEARNNLISVCRDWECGKKTTLLPIVAIRARYFLEHITEPKPAEWSEEDEDTYKRVYSLFNNANEAWYKAIFTGCFPAITKEKVLNMLKSLRPQPKEDLNAIA